MAVIRLIYAAPQTKVNPKSVNNKVQIHIIQLTRSRHKKSNKTKLNRVVIRYNHFLRLYNIPSGNQRRLFPLYLIKRCEIWLVHDRIQIKIRFIQPSVCKELKVKVKSIERMKVKNEVSNLKTDDCVQTFLGF